MAWLGVSAALSAGQRDGSAQVELMSQARIAALQARADEALTLVAHGNGAAFESDYKPAMDQLTSSLTQAVDRAGDPDVRATLRDALAKAQAWRAVHTKVRAADDGGRYSDAVTLAVGTADPAGASALANGIATASAAFDADAARAGRSLSGTAVGFAVLTLVLLAGAITGYQQRIAEYR